VLADCVKPEVGFGARRTWCRGGRVVVTLAGTPNEVHIGTRAAP
jgi:hypothetical protein